MQNDKEAREKSATRFEFWRFVAGLSLVTNLALALGTGADAWRVLYERMHITPPQIIAMGLHHEVMNVIPVDQPRMNDADLENWTAKHVLKICKLDWLNWKDQLNDARNGFDDSGWNRLWTELEKKEVIKSLIQSRLTENCSIKDPARLINKGTMNGALIFDIQIPVVLRYYGADKSHDRSESFIITTQVLQEPIAEYEDGVAIFNVQFDPYKDSSDGS